MFLLASVASSGDATAAPVCDFRAALPANYPACSVGQRLFDTDEHRPAGAGFIDSFLRLQPVNTKTIAAAVYREFFLGAEETAATNEGRRFITLDQLQIYRSNTPLPNAEFKRGNRETIGALMGATQLYGLDTASDDDIQITYRLGGEGGGSTRKVSYLPGSASINDRYVYLYSQFGEIDDVRRGSDTPLEEIPGRPISEPVNLGLLATGIVAGWRRLKMSLAA